LPLLCAGQTLQQYYSEAISAYKAKDYKLFYEKIKEANKLHPYHQGVQYQLGLAAALIGKNPEAITFLKKAVLTNADFVLENNQDLKSIWGLKEFKALLELQKKLKTPIIQSDTAFTITDRQLHVEGIDFDKKSNSFYLGSIHKRKVIKVDDKGIVTDFCASGFEGMTSVFGLKVDSKRNLLWVCSSPMAEMQGFDSTARSGVFKFNLGTGKLIQKYIITNPEPDGIFGDLILNSKGQPFISDSKNNKILMVNETAGKIESIFSSDEFWNIQGLTFSADEKSLFISDYIKGIFKLNLTSKTLDEIKCTLDVSLKGIDGLYLFENSLLAIQNGVNPFHLTKYTLNKEGTYITQFEVLENNHPAFGEPTLGSIQEKNFYYIANSQWGGYEKDHRPKSSEKLQDIVVLKLLLKK
jgi:hypothetical protein